MMCDPLLSRLLAWFVLGPGIAAAVAMLAILALSVSQNQNQK